MMKAKIIYEVDYEKAFNQSIKNKRIRGAISLRDTTIMKLLYRDIVLLNLNFYLGLKASELAALKWSHIIDKSTYRLKTTSTISLPTGERFIFINNTKVYKVLKASWDLSSINSQDAFESPVLPSCRTNDHCAQGSLQNRICELYNNVGVNNVSSRSGSNALKFWLKQTDIKDRIKGIITANKKQMNIPKYGAPHLAEISMAEKIMGEYSGPHTSPNFKKIETS